MQELESSGLYDRAHNNVYFTEWLPHFVDNYQTPRWVLCNNGARIFRCSHNTVCMFFVPSLKNQVLHIVLSLAGWIQHGWWFKCGSRCTNVKTSRLSSMNQKTCLLRVVLHISIPGYTDGKVFIFIISLMDSSGMTSLLEATPKVWMHAGTSCSGLIPQICGMLPAGYCRRDLSKAFFNVSWNVSSTFFQFMGPLTREQPQRKDQCPTQEAKTNWDLLYPNTNWTHRQIQ